MTVSTDLVSDGLCPAIRALAAKTGRIHAAMAYVTRDVLPVGGGDVPVVELLGKDRMM